MPYETKLEHLEDSIRKAAVLTKSLMLAIKFGHQALDEKASREAAAMAFRHVEAAQQIILEGDRKSLGPLCDLEHIEDLAENTAGTMGTLLVALRTGGLDSDEAGDAIEAILECLQEIHGMVREGRELGRPGKGFQNLRVVESGRDI